MRLIRLELKFVANSLVHGLGNNAGCLTAESHCTLSTVYQYKCSLPSPLCKGSPLCKADLDLLYRLEQACPLSAGPVTAPPPQLYYILLRGEGR
jgi:hypothetical protein